METTYSWQTLDDQSTRMKLRNRREPAVFATLAGSVMTAAMRRAFHKDLGKLRDIGRPGSELSGTARGR